ncbi:MAG: glycosyltransferase [Gemmatimonadetes bacterium]|jgi:glycosyltransferase involved in cell wall biosynthesis|nr:glycosyltransferase [Gemmatimonadota bacterium]MBT6144315.1 glycosyltransferase [Gemmatimonadota bacterium]MBT7864539.1 glycosyltransferase [Gemmatimonadota bacterium]
MTELSVIIPSYRAPDLLKQALVSLGQEAGDPGLAEIIVVDDGSPDFEAGACDGLTGQWPLKVLHLDQNRGRAIARNTGLRAAQGRVVVFLDGDMSVCPGFLAAHALFHRQQTRAIAVGGICFAPSIRVNAMTRYIHSRGVARFGAGEVPYKCFVTGNSSVPREALVETGGFDEAFVTYGGEDLELGYRLHQLGLRVHYLPQARSLHHQVRPFADMGQAMAAYGRDSVPILLSRHPELDSLLHLDFLRQSRWNPRRWLLGLALFRPVQLLVGALVLGLLPWRLPAILFDYLWWSHRTRGYLGRDTRHPMP